MSSSRQAITRCMAPESDLSCRVASIDGSACGGCRGAHCDHAAHTAQPRSGVHRLAGALRGRLQVRLDWPQLKHTCPACWEHLLLSCPSAPECVLASQLLESHVSLASALACADCRYWQGDLLTMAKGRHVAESYFRQHSLVAGAASWRCCRAPSAASRLRLR